MKTLGWLLAAATIAAAAPAAATTYTMTLDGGSINVGSGNGNTRTFSSTVGGQTLTLTATGWTNALDQTPDHTLASFLGQYGGLGLGVTNPGENGLDNSHVVDNVGREDFILLKFSTAVDLTSMNLNVFDVNDFGSADSDATIFYKNGATGPTDGGLSSTYFNQFGAQTFGVAGGSSSGSRTVDVGNHYSDTWIVSAATGQGGNGNDGFKLYSVTVNTAAVPEPATWAMMLIGFGGLGASLRARRRVALAA